MSDLNAQILLDRAAISDVFHNYAAGVDRRDWDLFRSCFTDDVSADFTSLLPGDVCHGADKWVAAAARLIGSLDGTQHIITNHVHLIDGDTAKSRSYLQAQHVKNDENGVPQHYLLGGYYSYDMVRTPQGWKIKDYSLTKTWSSGDPALLAPPSKDQKLAPPRKKEDAAAKKSA